MQTRGTAIMQFHPAFQTETGLGKTAQVSLYSAQKADSPPGISLLPHYLQASSAPCDTEQRPSVDAAGTESCWTRLHYQRLYCLQLLKMDPADVGQLFVFSS